MALAIAICVFGLTLIIGSLVMFAFGTRENQSSPPSTAAETVFTVGLFLAFLIAASYWLPFLEFWKWLSIQLILGILLRQSP